MLVPTQPPGISTASRCRTAVLSIPGPLAVCEGRQAATESGTIRQAGIKGPPWPPHHSQPAGTYRGRPSTSRGTGQLAASFQPDRSAAVWAVTGENGQGRMESPSLEYIMNGDRGFLSQE